MHFRYSCYFSDSSLFGGESEQQVCEYVEAVINNRPTYWAPTVEALRACLDKLWLLTEDEQDKQTQRRLLFHFSNDFTPPEPSVWFTREKQAALNLKWTEFLDSLLDNPETFSDYLELKNSRSLERRAEKRRILSAYIKKRA